MTTSARHSRPETPGTPLASGNCAGGAPSSSRGKPSAPSSDHPHYGALRRVTREVLAPLWLDSRITTEEIARRLGVGPSGLCYHAKVLGLGARPKRGIPADTRARDAEFRRLWLAGVKLTDIAEHLGMSRGYAGQKRMHLGLPARHPRKGAGGFGGFGTITLQQYREQELGRLMGAAS